MKEDLYCAEEMYAWMTRRCEELKKIIDEKKLALNNIPDDLPPGKIRAAYNGKNRTREQFYWRSSAGEHSGHYIKKTKENQKIIRTMIQREYDEKILNAALSEYNFLKRGKKFGGKDPLITVYESLGACKQKWVEPVILTDAAYAKEWNEKQYPINTYKSENQFFVTKREEHVRSKSELFIANMLHDYDIPYRYECPLQDKKGIWAVPDFTVLNVHRRKTYYWEHFGMMSDPGYCSKALKKLRDYEMHNMYPGREVIFTFESAERPIDTKSIERLIQVYFVVS